MKVAVIGSRGIGNINISDYIPEEVTEIISGGAKGVDSLLKRTQISGDSQNILSALIIKSIHLALHQ